MMVRDGSYVSKGPKTPTKNRLSPYACKQWVGVGLRLGPVEGENTSLRWPLSGGGMNSMLTESFAAEPARFLAPYPLAVLYGAVCIIIRPTGQEG